jgi:hypothetical protein
VKAPRTGFSTKNVANLAYTRQLRDNAAYAAAKGLDFDLYVRVGTTISAPLRAGEAAGRIKVIRVLP